MQDILDRGQVGAVQPWHSATSGGNVKLVRGGAKAGQSCGVVRTTVLTQGRESSGYAFRYCRDAKGEWRTVG